MKRFLLNRVVGSAVVLLGVSVITFVLARVIPSNAAALYIGPRARPEDIERVTRQLGLDQPLPIQYLTYMRDMLTGDWGTSIGTKRPVLDEILGRLPATLELIVAAMIVAIPLGIVLGVLSARWRRRPPDMGVRFVSIVGGLTAGVLPGPPAPDPVLPQPPGAAAGRADLGRPAVHRPARIDHRVQPDRQPRDRATGRRSGDSASHLSCRRSPWAHIRSGSIARMTRSSMLETLDQDYIRTARAFGLPQRPDQLSARAAQRDPAGR